MVEEAEELGNSISSVARKYEIHPNQPFAWRRLMYEGALVAAGSEEQSSTTLGGPGSLKAEIRELQRLLGKDHGG